MILTNENLKNLQIWKSIFIGYELKIYLILKKKILMFVGISDFLKKLRRNFKLFFLVSTSRYSRNVQLVKNRLV